MCEPDVLFSMATHQHADIFNSEYAQKFREDSWSDYGPHYGPDVMTFYNGVHFPRYLGYKEGQPDRTNFTPHSRYFDKNTDQSVNESRAAAQCNCINCNSLNKNINDTNYTQGSYEEEFEPKKEYHNKCFTKEKYIIRTT